jgi:hypothetical protein
MVAFFKIVKRECYAESIPRNLHFVDCTAVRLKASTSIF